MPFHRLAVGWQATVTTSLTCTGPLRLLHDAESLHPAGVRCSARFGPSTRVTPRRDLTCRHPETAGDEVHPPDEALRLARDLPEQRLDAGQARGLDQPLLVAHPQAPLA